MAVEERGEYPPRIGVALSGGGHRATLFSLGVLLYLVDAGLNDWVETISSVSGGSITNGYVAQECDFRSVSAPEFRRVASRLGRVVAFRGTVFSSWLTWLYLGFVVALLAAAIAVGFLSSGALRIVAFFTSITVLGLSVGVRGFVASAALGRALFTHGPRRTLLADAHDTVCHVLCSTDLLAGRPVYFSSRFIHSGLYGWSPPESVKLQTAVQASAALPGAFPPRRFDLRKLPFRASLANARVVYLVDGGVYNNLGTDWFDGLQARRGVLPLPDPPDLLLVVSSSAPGALKVQRRVPLAMRLPYLREVAFMPRVMDVLYANTVQPRLVALERESSSFEPDSPQLWSSSMKGWKLSLVIAIDSDPKLISLLPRVKGATSGSRYWQAARERANRSSTMFDTPTYDFAGPKSIPTNLGRLGRERTELLIRHGYLCAMSCLHAYVGSALFDLERVEEQLAGIMDGPE